MKCPKCDGAIELMGDYGGDLYLACEKGLECAWEGSYLTDAILLALEDAISKMPQELLNNAS